MAITVWLYSYSVDRRVSTAVGPRELQWQGECISDQRSCHLHEAERKVECAQPFPDVAFAPVVVARVSDDEDLGR